MSELLLRPGFVCRGCGAALLREDVFVDLGAQPMANGLLTAEQLDLPEVRYPLRPLVCRSCLLVQLPVVPKREELFTPSYPFFSGQSAAWVQHCEEFAWWALGEFDLDKYSRVLEIGSNDGTMLRPFLERGIQAVGVEPSEGPAQHALMKGLSTFEAFWGCELAKKLLRTPGGASWQADLVIANNVLAHVPDLHDFLLGVRAILSPTGVVSIEFAYVGSLIDSCQFDQVYAEHHCYFSLRSLAEVLGRNDLTPFHAEYLGVHGGSMRVLAGPYKTRNSRSGNWEAALQTEAEAGLHDHDKYLEFAGKVSHKLRAQGRLARMMSVNTEVVGYGASAKAVTTINALGLSSADLEGVVDTTPAKWDTFLPGSRIPVRHPSWLAETQPGVVINFLHNWREESERNIREACPNAHIVCLSDVGLLDD